MSLMSAATPGRPDRVSRSLLAKANQSVLFNLASGVRSKDFSLRFGAALGVFSTEEELLKAHHTLMFMYSSNSLEVLDSSEFFCRSLWRIIHQGLSPSNAFHIVAKNMSRFRSSKWLRQKLEDTRERLSVEVDSDANRSLQFLLGETWAKSQRSWDLFPSSIYLILKYEDNLTASLMANAQLPGERAARAVAIGLVLGAYHGLQAVQALRNSCHAFDKALKLLRRLPLFRPSFLLPTNNETPLTDVPWMKGQLPSVLCFDTLFTALSCCGANEHDNLACWGPEGMKERCCDVPTMLVRKEILQRMQSMGVSEASREVTQEDLAERAVYRFGTATPEKWCSKKALIEEEGDVIVSAYDTLVSKVTMTGRLVNVGAGSVRDPLWELADARNVSRAVFIDPGGPIPGQVIPRGVQFLTEAAEPGNLAFLLRKGKLLPKKSPGVMQIDFLKVDVDGCDCVLAALLLRLVRPKVIIMEINWSLPPPLRFVRQCHEGWWSTWIKFGSLGLTPSTHGCSLSGAVAELSHFGYSLWRLSGNVNALFVRDDMVKYLGGHVDEVRCYNEAWKYPRMVRYMDPILMDDWRKGSVENALKHAWSNFSCYHTLLNISYLPFSLSV